MKCPECGYISFDNNVVCPKCSKDISDQMKKLNLPTYKTNTPSMLGSLIGETGEEKPKAPMDDQTQEQEQKPEITPGDSQPAEKQEISFDDDGNIDLDATFDSIH